MTEETATDDGQRVTTEKEVAECARCGATESGRKRTTVTSVTDDESTETVNLDTEPDTAIADGGYPGANDVTTAEEDDAVIITDDGSKDPSSAIAADPSDAEEAPTSTEDGTTTPTDEETSPTETQSSEDFAGQARDSEKPFEPEDDAIFITSDEAEGDADSLGRDDDGAPGSDAVVVQDEDGVMEGGAEPPTDEPEVYCPRCSYSKLKEHSSERPGDGCPSCASAWLRLDEKDEK